MIRPPPYPTPGVILFGNHCKVAKRRSVSSVVFGQLSVREFLLLTKLNPLKGSVESTHKVPTSLIL